MIVLPQGRFLLFLAMRIRSWTLAIPHMVVILNRRKCLRDGHFQFEATKTLNGRLTVPLMKSPLDVGCIKEAAVLTWIKVRLSRLVRTSSDPPAQRANNNNAQSGRNAIP